MSRLKVPGRRKSKSTKTDRPEKTSSGSKPIRARQPIQIADSKAPATKSTGLMPEDLKRSAREQEARISIVGHPHRRAS